MLLLDEKQKGNRVPTKKETIYNTIYSKERKDYSPSSLAICSLIFFKAE